MSISNDSPMTLYQQIVTALKKDMQKGVLSPGQRIGSQKELEERFNVSKITIRKAISLLEEEGLVTTVHGKGTYVTKDKVEQNLDHLQSLTDIIKMSGFHPDVEIIKQQEVRLENDNVEEEQDCLYIERLHSIENNPVALAKIYIPIVLTEGITKQHLEKNTIYEILEEKQGVKLQHATQSIEACPATVDMGKVLNVDEGTPLLKAKRYVYDEDGKLVEKITFYYRYDAFAFKVALNKLSITPMWPNV